MTRAGSCRGVGNRHLRGGHQLSSGRCERRPVPTKDIAKSTMKARINAARAAAIASEESRLPSRLMATCRLSRLNREAIVNSPRTRATDRNAAESTAVRTCLLYTSDAADDLT